MRRSKEEISSKILSFIKENQIPVYARKPVSFKGVKEWWIMQGCGLNYRMLKKYLRNLETAGLIMKKSSFWEITDKGNQALELRRALDTILEATMNE